MNISTDLLNEVIAHALEDPTIECCGLIAIEPGSDNTQTATCIYRANNIHASALKFEIDPIEQLKLTTAIEDQGWEIGAIYHSHVRSEPKPSQTDISFAAGTGRIEWVIVGLAGEGDPDVRSYLIEAGRVREVALEVG
jgi:[CysO sulfur-carrier protein]-S-L-cysteine hydrolase